MVFIWRGRCSGVVLAQDLVLTAAHCTIDTTGLKIVGHVAATPFQVADVAEVAPHPQLSAAASPRPGPTPDLALLKLSKPLPAGFAPAFLGTRPVAVGDRLIVVGYGVATQGDGKTAGTPRMAALVVTSRSNDLLTLRDASRGTIGGCAGDSGAPAFAIRGGIPALAGVVSGGQCGAFTLIVPFAPHRDWIQEVAHRLGSSVGP